MVSEDALAGLNKMVNVLVLMGRKKRKSREGQRLNTVPDSLLASSLLFRVNVLCAYLRPFSGEDQGGAEKRFVDHQIRGTGLASITV
jgi:hypothetical protein